MTEKRGSVKNCEGAEINPMWKRTYYASFMGAGRRQETPRSEEKNFY